MGRKRAKGASSATTRLTPKQFDLLTWVYLKGYRELGHSQITWSPRAYMGRSPSRSEAATLSKRVSTLVEYGLLDRWGKDLKLTGLGIDLLHIYALENADEPDIDVLLIRLELDDDILTLGAYGKVRKALEGRRWNMKLSQEDVDKAIESLSPLYKALLERIEDGAKRLGAALEANQETVG